jgi:hypothetical protein
VNRLCWYASGAGGEKKNILFYITDLPNYCEIESITFNTYNGDAVDTLALSAWIDDFSASGGNGDAWGSDAGGVRQSLFSAYGTTTYGSWQIFTKTCTTPNTFYRDRNALVFSAYTGIGAHIWAIMPVIKVQCTHTSVSPWQPCP